MAVVAPIVIEPSESRRDRPVFHPEAKRYRTRAYDQERSCPVRGVYESVVSGAVGLAQLITAGSRVA